MLNKNFICSIVFLAIYIVANLKCESDSEPVVVANRTCYAGYDIDPNLMMVDGKTVCSSIKGLSLVECPSNSSSCFGFLNSKLKLQFGCSIDAKCEIYHNCCYSD